MLKIRGGKLRWSKEDVVPMATIIGADAAVRQSAPYLASLLKMAEKKGVLLSDRAHRQLELERRFRTAAKNAKRMPDAEGPAAFRPHQRADLYYMRMMHLHSYLLAHRVGAGKTLEAIRWATDVVQASRILVITLNSVKYQWADEIQRWSWDTPAKAMSIHVVDGPVAEQIQQTQAKKGWVIGHWESLVHARLGYLAKDWDVIIADECHMAQNRDAQRTEVLQRLQAPNRLALTAHPYANHPGELYPILQFLYPEFYTSYWRFFFMHVDAVPKQFGGFDINGPKRPNLLKWELEPFMLRRTTGLGMPKLTQLARYAVLPAQAQKEYERIKEQFFAELETHDGPRLLAIPSILARVTRLRQYLVDPGLVGAKQPSVKYPIVAELVEASEAPVVIFTSFQKAARRLGAFLSKRKLAIEHIDGSVPVHSRRRVQQHFRDGKYDALIVVTQAGGAALNLGGYGEVIFLDLPWTARDYEQAIGRVDRPQEGTGAVVPTTVQRVVVRDSYETRLQEKLAGKFDMFKQVFTVSQLKELFG